MSRNVRFCSLQTTTCRAIIVIMVWQGLPGSWSNPILPVSLQNLASCLHGSITI